MIPISALFPFAGAIFVLFLAIYMRRGNRGSRINELFSFFAFLVFIWLFATAMLLMAKNEDTVVFWDRIVYSAVIFIPAVLFQFSTFFLRDSFIQRAFKVFGYLASTLFLYFIIFTERVISGVNWYGWGAHSEAGNLHTPLLVFFGSYLGLMFINLFRAYRYEKTERGKMRIKYFIIAIAILTLGSSAFLPAYGINIYPVTYIPGILFVVIIAYAINRYEEDINRSFASQFFLLFIVLVTFLEITTSETWFEGILRLLFFVVVAAFSSLIVKNVRAEVMQREKSQKLSEELQIVNERLVRLDKAKSDMLSIAAHQLRTPLTAMNGYLSLVMEGATGETLGTKTSEMITKVSRATTRLGALVNNLLNMSRIDDGRMQYAMQPLQIEDMIRETTETFDILAQEKGLQFDVDLPTKALTPVVVDDNKIHEVFSNLINNAIKYTKEGKITVRAWQQDAGHVRFSVVDTGVGVSKEVASKLFSKFSRADKQQLNTEGAGIGLYVCYNIVHDHGGRIWVESDGEGKGSEFIVELSVERKV